MKKLKGVRELLKYLKKDLFKLVLLLILSVIVGVISLFPVQIIGFLIDILSNSDLKGIKLFLLQILGNNPIKIIILFGIIYLLQSVLSQIYGYLVTIFNYSIIEEVRKDLFRWILWKPKSLNEENISGDIITRVTGDIQAITMVVAGPLNGLLTNLLRLLFSVMILAYWNIRIALISIIMIPIIYYLSIWISKVNKEMAMKERSFVGKISNNLSDIMDNLPIIKTFSTEDSEIEYIDNMSDELFSIKKENANLMNRYFGTVSTINTIGLVGTFIFLYIEIKSGRCSPGDIAVAYTYLGNMYSSMMSISRFGTDIFKADASLARIFELKEEKTNIEDIPLEENKSIAIKFENVSIAYDNISKNILNNISFNIPSGSLMAITGKSGIGKSTILNTLAGFTNITNGTIYINDNRYISKVEGISNISRFCFQKPYLFRRSLWDNIIYDSGDKLLLDNTIETLEVDKIINSKGKDYLLNSINQNLSGGEQRRIAFCRTLNKTMPLYIFDEPTAELDEINRTKIIETIKYLKGKATIVVSTHDNDLMELADIKYNIN